MIASGDLISQVYIQEQVLSGSGDQELPSDELLFPVSQRNVAFPPCPYRLKHLKNKYDKEGQKKRRQ